MKHVKLIHLREENMLYLFTFASKVLKLAHYINKMGNPGIQLDLGISFKK